MCLGIPGQVTETYHDQGVLMGKVSFDGVVRRVCLAHVADVQPGEYVIVHVGFALSKIDATEARRVFDLLAEMQTLDDLNVPSLSGRSDGNGA
jgi:hydrogenase expression/formation protein HypC